MFFVNSRAIIERTRNGTIEIKGPIDSVGVYFRCRAQGELLKSGDETKDPRWVALDELRRLMNDDPLQFSDVDRAGILFYLKHIG